MNIPNEHRAIILASLDFVMKHETDLLSSTDNTTRERARAAIEAISNADEFEMQPLSEGVKKKTVFVAEAYQQKAKVMMFNVLLLLDQIYPRAVWPGAPDYDNGDSGSVLVKQAWVAVEAFQKEIKNGKG